MSIFFFSSRRRHTRSLRDWSSDVCSSDLRGARRWGPPGDRWRAQQTLILVGYVAPGLFDGDYAAARVLAAILGGGMSGRLFGELREQQGLADRKSVV